MKKKVYTVTVRTVMSVPFTSSRSTTDVDQATRFTASLASDVESTMRVYGRIHKLDVSISARDVDEESIPENHGKWFWCTLNGDPYDDNVKDIPSGEDPVDGLGEYYHALNLASPVPAYKFDGKIFEHWFEVVEYCKNKLGK